MKEPTPERVQKKGISRRTLLKGAAAVATGAAIGLYRHYNDEDARSPEDRPEQQDDAALERFDKRVEGYRAWWTLERDQIAFLDHDGAVVGEPVSFQDFVVNRSEVGRGGEGKYLLTPAPKDEQGNYEIDNIPGEWIRYVQNQHAKLFNVAPESLAAINVTQDFKAALAESDEPELVSGVRSGTIRTVMDIVHYFGDKPVRGAEHQTRIEHVREAVEFTHPHMSETVQQELRTLLPAICAKESKFNDDVTSAAGARGISQFMPATWRGLGYQPYGRFEPLSTQVEAMGKHCDNIYSELRSNGIEELLEDYVVPLFKNREAYERDFLVPCMINAYNPGAGTMRAAIIELLEKNSPDSLAKQYQNNAGKELFYDLVLTARAAEDDLLAHYGTHSAAYPFFVYAAKEELFHQESQKLAQK